MFGLRDRTRITPSRSPLPRTPQASATGSVQANDQHMSDVEEGAEGVATGSSSHQLVGGRKWLYLLIVPCLMPSK